MNLKPTDKRNTKQKQIITDVILSMYHPTADEILKKVNEIDPTIGRATVFRTLNSLVEDKTIQKIYFDKKIVYDTNNSEHNHFVCLKCGKIMDLSINNNQDNISIINIPGVSEIKTTSITYYGICDECKLK